MRCSQPIWWGEFACLWTSSIDFAGANNAPHGSSDAYVAKLNGNDGSLAWTTYVGGSGIEGDLGIAVDSAGNALVKGTTYSTDFAGANNVFHGGSRDAFVAKVNGGDGATAWATYLGGSLSESAFGIAADADGNALVTGYTSSADFAGANNALQVSPSDGFAAKVTSTGSLAWATYFGVGSGGSAIAVDGYGNALVTGYVRLLGGFPGANNAPHGGSDAFVAKFTSNGSLAWATHVGGSTSGESGEGIAIDGAGNALVTGNTGSTDFVGANNAYHGNGDVFVAKVTSNGSLAWATYVGGSSNDQVKIRSGSIAIDGAGNAVLTGYTQSTDFESTEMAGPKYTYGTPPSGGVYYFAMKFTPPAWAFSTYTVNPLKRINEGSTVTSQLVVSGSYPIVDVNVTVSITHPSDADLRLVLVAPDGTQVPLVNAGSISGWNLAGTVFDDEAPSPITAGTAPYTGNYRPATPLSALDGKLTNGTWKLQVTDNVRNKRTGTLNSWGLSLLYNTAP